MNVAIAGYGIEGKVSYQYWNERGFDVTIVDERKTLDSAPDGAATILGTGTFEQLDRFDLVIRTPSLAPEKIKTNGKIWSATNEFFAKCPAQIIGVTGTKGKGTTCSLIANILHTAGQTTHLVGNIGQPALEVLPRIKPDDVVIYELSSFQLWDLERSPHIAVVLMIEPDHLDIHADIDEYINAKSNIARHQTSDDIIVYHQTNQAVRDIASLSIAKTRISYPFDISEFLQVFKLPGEHNRDNLSAAVAAVRQYGVSDGTIKNSISQFDGLPHRLQFIAEVDGVKYYDDSIGTTPGSSIAALRSFDNPKVLILGGSTKGADYTPVIAECTELDVTVIAIGHTGELITDICNKMDVKVIRETGPMRDVVAVASEIATKGGVVILSPASASFDQYKSYVDRGEQFASAVKELRGSR